MRWEETLLRSKRTRAAIANLIIGRGMVQKAVAWELGINPKTAEFHWKQAQLAIKRSTDSWMKVESHG